VKNLYKKSTLLLALSLLIAPVLFFLPTNAATLQNRKVEISSSTPSKTNQIYKVTFIPAASPAFASMRFEFCENSPLASVACIAPAGLNLDPTPATLTAESGNTGFNLHAVGSNTNTLIYARAAAPAISTQSSYTFGGITNPSAVNNSVFIRITLHSSTDGTGAAFERGAVAYAITPTFNIGAYVPPYMTLCVAQTVAVNCSTAVGNLIDFGEFSSATASTATTQFSIATNDPTGYNAFISGQTMTSGNNVIPALDAQSSSITGVSQFGFNLRANSSPTVGANSDGGGTGVPNSTYNTPNQFRFVDGDLIASSPITTNHTRYTVSYIVNVAEGQAAGIYASTLTFTSVASF
jgi:hypothetical protein